MDLKEQLRRIPFGREYIVLYYETDDEMVLYLWDPSTQISYDIRFTKD